MTENEAKDILEEVKILDDSMYQYNMNYLNALDVAIKSFEEIQQYRAIGTVEECREARERHMAKKPTHFYKKYGKHKWRRKENGEIDDFAWEFDYHNGVACEICGETVCVHCNPNYDDLDDCKKEHWN